MLVLAKILFYIFYIVLLYILSKFYKNHFIITILYFLYHRRFFNTIFYLISSIKNFYFIYT